MTGAEFVRSVRKLGRANGVAVRLQTKRGKGSHVTRYYGSRKTIVADPKRTLKPGTFRAMLRQLGIDPHELR